MDAEIAVRATGYGFGHQVLHFLRDDTDIGLAAAEIAEAIVAETIGEMTEQYNIVLQCDVGASSTTTAAAEATAAASAPETATTATTTEAASSATGECHTATAARTHSGHAGPARGRLRSGSPA